MEVTTAPPKDLDEALADVSTRFVLNLPKDHPPSVERLFIQLQQAYWFYEDFMVDSFEHLPHLSERRFSLELFERNPVLKHYKDNHADYMKRFREYLHSIPAYGAIMFNEDLSKVLLVRGYNGQAYGFPKGKINEAESETQCAKREVWEEVGYDVEMMIEGDQFISYMSSNKFVKLFIVVGVPEDSEFKTQTRKEVSEIRWFPLKEILAATKSKSFGPIMPALGMLKKWLRKHYPGKMKAMLGNAKGAVDEKKRTEKSPRTAKEEKDNSPGHDRNAATFGTSGGRWTVEEMFAANEALLGKKFDYDGNPHSFASARDNSDTSEEAADPKSDVAETEDEKSVPPKSDTDTDSENVGNFEFDHVSILETLRQNVEQSTKASRQRAEQAKTDIRRLLSQF